VGVTAGPHAKRDQEAGGWHSPGVAVLRRLAAGLSPELAARTLKHLHRENQALYFSHETIYQAIYAMPHGELRIECRWQ
jgi:IS30 family transposase